MTDSSRRKPSRRIAVLPPAAVSAAATLRAYKADWTHFSTWCDAHGFVAIPAAPAVVGAYLASLADSHAPATIRRRLAVLGKLHRYNDLPWNPSHGAIQGPLQGVLRLRGRPPAAPGDGRVAAAAAPSACQLRCQRARPA